MRATQIFKATTKEVRCFILKETIWFMLDDICKLLDINFESAIDKLDETQKQFFVKEYWIINESGFYKLLFQSENGDAKRFQKWLKEELGSDIDSVMKTLLPNHFVFSTHKDGRFELRQKIDTSRVSTYKFFTIIKPNETPRIKKVGTVTIDGKIWFCAIDVMRLCGLLGHTLAELKEDKEIKLFEGKIIIDEAGMYYHLFASNNADARTFAKLTKQKFFPTDETQIFEWHATNSKKFRIWVKEELPKYIRIAEDGMIQYKEKCKEQSLNYRLFPTYPLSA